MSLPGEKKAPNLPLRAGIALGAIAAILIIGNLINPPANTRPASQFGVSTHQASAPVAANDDVQWGDYVDTLKGDLDAMGVANDCPSLQTMFDNAYDNNTATINRTGHGNSKLMGYIDTLLRDADCYG